MNKTYKYIYNDDTLEVLNKGLPYSHTLPCCVCNKNVSYHKYFCRLKYMQQTTWVGICSERCLDILSSCPTSIDTYLSFYGHKKAIVYIDPSRYTPTYMDIYYES